MLSFSTTHEERIPHHFIVRIHGHRDGAVVYSRDAACYVKEGDGWCFGAIPSTGKPTISPIVTDKATARKMAERTAEMMWKADLAAKRVA